MLTKQESIQTFDFRALTAEPDRLTRHSHGHYLPLAEAMLTIYRSNVGSTRQQIHAMVRQQLRPIEDCPTRRVSAFCKLLDDASAYHRDKGGTAAKLRQRVFSMAAELHPLVTQSNQLFEYCEADAKAKIARALKMSWDEIEAKLFADVIEFNRLRNAPQEMSGADLLARYNVAQTQAALYGALRMTVWTQGDLKTIVRYAKLARLMHSIERHGETYQFGFDGPASVVRQTRRYGVSFAQFLPGLLAARNWRMQATILGPKHMQFALRLSSGDGLRSEIDDKEFDSSVEQRFAEQWSEADTDGWTMHRESTILHEGQTVFLPDFTFAHSRHGEALLEIVGFWTPEYLQAKAEKLKQFQSHARLILAVADSVVDSLPPLDLPTVTYKSALHPAQVLELLRAVSV